MTKTHQVRRSTLSKFMTASLVASVLGLLPANPANATVNNTADLSSGNWTVPAGVQTVQLIATGGRGGNATSAAGAKLGGPGCEAFGSVPVSQGNTISAVLGQVGGDGQTSGGTSGYDFAGGVGGAGAFRGGDGGQAWATGSDAYPFYTSLSGGGGGGGATGIKVNGTYQVVGAGGSGASGEYSGRSTYQCSLIMFPRNFGFGGLAGMNGSTAEGGAYTQWGPNYGPPSYAFPSRGGFWTQPNNSHVLCGNGTRSAREGGDGGPEGAGIGGKGADGGWFFQGGTCSEPYMDRSGRAGGGGGGGWQGGGGGASGSSGNVAGPGGPGTNLAPKTASESADFKTAALSATPSALVKWVSIDSTLPSAAATPGEVVSTTLAATFGDGTTYTISSGYNASWQWTATGLPSGWTINSTTGVLAGTVPATGVNITVTADYRVGSWNPTFSYGTRTVAKTSRVYRIGPAAPLLATSLTYTGTTSITVGSSAGVTLSGNVSPAECTGTVMYTVRDSGGTIMNGPAAAQTLDTSGWAEGTYTVTLTYAEDSTCAGATATGTFVIGAASVFDPITVESDAVTITYGQTPTLNFTDDGFAEEDGWETEPTCAVYTTGASPALVTTTPIPAGTYDIVCSGGVPDSGYEVTDYTSATLTVNKAEATCTVNAYSMQYNGLEHRSTGQCLGVDGAALPGLDLDDTSHVIGGEYTDTWVFTDETGNYEDDEGEVDNEITKIIPQISYVGRSGVITVGTSVTLAATVSPAVCTGPISYSLTYPDGTVVTPVSSPLNTTSWAPGIYTITATYTEDSSCQDGSDSAALVVGSAGDSTTGGGWYKVSSGISGSPRVNFGYTVQKNVKTDKATGQTTTTHRGQILWINSQKWRMKGSIYTVVVRDASGNVINGATEGFLSVPCPNYVGVEGSNQKCGVIVGTGTLERYNEETGGWEAVLSGSSPAVVTFNATLYDGGQISVCKNKRCTSTDLADFFGLTISGVAVVNQVPVTEPIVLSNSQNGSVVIRSN